MIIIKTYTFSTSVEIMSWGMLSISYFHSSVVDQYHGSRAIQHEAMGLNRNPLKHRNYSRGYLQLLLYKLL